MGAEATEATRQGRLLEEFTRQIKAASGVTAFRVLLEVRDEKLSTAEVAAELSITEPAVFQAMRGMRLAGLIHGKRTLEGVRYAITERGSQIVAIAAAMVPGID